jgi:hypothetical protein
MAVVACGGEAGDPREPAPTVGAHVADSMWIEVRLPMIVGFYPTVGNDSLERDEGLATALDDFSYHMGTAIDSLDAIDVGTTMRSSDTLWFRSGARRWFVAPPRDRSDIGYVFADSLGRTAVVHGVRGWTELVASAREFAATGTVTASASDQAPPPVSTATDAATWSISPTRFGPLTIGMRLAEAAPLVQGSLEVPGASDAQRCSYADWGGAPEQVRLMFVGDRLARVESDAPRIGTAEGARVGDSEARIDSIYGARVTTQPHKYTTGRYLIVREPAEGPTHAYVFETDGERVTRLRAGRLPEVEWVEGCS